MNEIGLFKEDLEQYRFLIDNFDMLSSDDIQMAYKLSKMMIVSADRWSEIAFNAGKISQETKIPKTDLYNWAYHKYRLLMNMHEFCRVVYRQCEENSRNRWNEN